MMTVGEHDRAWLDVMTVKIPAITEYAYHIANYQEIETQLKILKELGESGLYTREEYVRDLKTLAERAKFKFD